MNTIIDQKLYLMDEFLTELECADLIDYIENKRLQYTGPKYLNTRYGETIYDSELTQFLYSKLRPISPKVKNQTVYKSTERTVIMKYYEDSKGTRIHRDQKIESNETFCCIIYLNNVSQGGETSFFDDNYNLILSITPKAGKIVLFSPTVLHKGCDAKDVKYIICPSLCYIRE